MDPQWLSWSKQLQAIAQTGLTYARDSFDIERYRKVQEIAAEMMAQNSGASAETVLELFKAEIGYATPKVDIRAAVFDQDRILLVRERKDGKWTLPGGWADVGDSPASAAVREVKEESGYDVAARKLAMVYDRDRHGHPPIPYHCYKLFFICDLKGGKPAASLETDAVDFFAQRDLPPLSLSRVTPKEIEDVFGHYRNQHWPTSFD